MINTKYKNRMIYYDMIKDFLEYRLKAFDFRDDFDDQRRSDQNENKTTGFSDFYFNRKYKGNKLMFQERYYYEFYESTEGDFKDALDAYVKAARELEIKGEQFFCNLPDHIYEYTMDFLPRTKEESIIAGWDALVSGEFPEQTEEEYEAGYDVDEKTLRYRVQLIFDVLDKNKDLWM
jgi:hypothetical protein